MGKVYNKLVRDNIPKIIKDDGREPIVKVLDDKTFKKELEIKLLEEYKEVLSADTSEDRIEELADMLEIIRSLSILENKTLEDIIEVANLKRNKRGGFEKKIFLERVLENDEQI